MYIYLVRHGQSYVNLKEWEHGNSDEPLTELGRRQAEALARWLPTQEPHIDALYASTMKRARETAEPLARAYGLPIRFDDRLREIGNNRLDHTPWPEHALPREYADFWSSARPFSPTMKATADAESYMHFRTRVGMFIEEAVERHAGETIVIVAHGGVFDAVFDHVFNIGPWRHCEVWVHNTAVSKFEHVDHPYRERWRLHFHNSIEHLRGLDE